MPSVSNNEELERLQGFCEAKMKLPSSGLWVAVDDIEEEGLWKESLTGQPLNYTPPWAPNEPNGGTKENCAGFEGFCQWLDLPCNDWTYFCLCENKPRPILKLLGLCKKSLIDHDYQPQNDVKDIERLTLVGKSTWIEYDNHQNQWLMSVVHFNITGTSRASPTSYTLGKNTWTIIGDSGCNRRQNSYTIDLKMSGCKEREFTCHDGQCVRMEERCNQVPDCRDHSDEKVCKILVLEEGYNKRVPPVGKDERLKTLTSVPVDVSLTLLKVVAIEEEDHSIELQFQITLEWNEIRASFHNLKQETYMNALSLEEIERIWLPLVIYSNTDQHQTTRLGADWEWSTDVSVKRQGNFTRSSYEMVDETYIFKGEENALIMTQSYTHEFQCIYQLEKYPFDTQVSLGVTGF